MLRLPYQLGELPSAFHTAGLAALQLLVDWMQARGPTPGLDLVDRSEAGATLLVDRQGLGLLLDALFGADSEEQWVFARRKDTKDNEIPPLREERRLPPDLVRTLDGASRILGGAALSVEITKALRKPLLGLARLRRSEGRPLEAVDRKGQVLQIDEAALRAAVEAARTDPALRQPAYAYPRCVPAGAFLRGWSPSPPWLKLWRDFIWQIRRAVPKTRLPYERRAAGASTAAEVEALWKDLERDGPVPFSSALCPDLQAQSTSGQPVSAHAREALLLRFWPLVAQPFVLTGGGGFVSAVPDVAALTTFCMALPAAMQARDPRAAGLYPAAARLLFPEEAPLRVGRTLPADAGLLAWEVRREEKPGQALQLTGSWRLEIPEPEAQADYQAAFAQRGEEALVRLVHGGP
ncbi:MAG: type I-MYXAN CRISPR-associated protein Cmx8, partial [Nanoarchaeota archaeon]